MIDTFFNLQSIAYVYPMLIDGFVLTLKLVLCTVVAGLLGGVSLAVAYALGGRFTKALVILYVDTFRSLTPLVLLIFIFYGLPFLGIQLGNFFAAVLALSLNGSSYYGEIVRAGIVSVPRGQWDVIKATGLKPLQGALYVVLPQALRNVVGPLAGNTLELAKATSICSAVALPEFLRSAQLAQALVYNSTPLIVVALVYLALLWPLVRLVTRLERRVVA